jgi:LuxR family maltose regulon positive regulatory protein
VSRDPAAAKSDVRRGSRTSSTAAAGTRRAAAQVSVIPQAPRAFVPRQRLQDALDEATSHPLTVIVAPAGSGKTSTLAHWADSSNRTVRWFSCASGGGDEPTDRLRSALVDAAALEEAADDPYVVVVDDAHHLPASAWAMLEERLRDDPSDRLRLVLASRRDVPLALVTLELTGSVTVLRADVLGFTDDEARLLVALHAPDVTAEESAAVQGRARGWAAALVLGARTLFGAPDRRRAREALTRSERPVLDYLLSEVFTTLPAVTRHVLLCTADSEYVTDTSAVVLSGDPEAPTRLGFLAADGLLVTGYGVDAEGHRQWRYHPLLHEALRRQVAMDGPDHALAIASHARAARHHAAHGPVLDALWHATRAESPELLASLLVEEGPGLVLAGHEDEIVEGLAALPSQVSDKYPALVGVAALAHRGRGDVETAAMLAAHAVRAAEVVRHRLTAPLGGLRPSADQVSAPEAALLADAALLETWQARFGWTDSATAMRHSREVLGCQFDEPAPVMGATAGAHPAHQPPWPVAAARTPWLLNELAAAELWAAQFALAEVHTGEALVAAHALGQHRAVAGAYANRALIEMFFGRTQTALVTAELSLAAAELAGRREDSFLARAHLVEAWVSFSQLEYSRTEAALEHVRRISARASDPLVEILSVILRARLLADAGQVTEARQLVSSAPPVPDLPPSYLVRILCLFQAQWALLSGDVQEVQTLAAGMRADGWEQGATLMTAILTDLGGDAVSAARRLETLLDIPAEALQTVPATVASVYKLRMLLRGGNPVPVRAALHDVLNRVGGQRLLGALVFTGPDPALNEAVAAETRERSPHPFADEALAALIRYAEHRHDTGLATGPAGSPGPSSSAPADALVTTIPAPTRSSDGQRPAVSLTDRETDVLRELALGGSYVDIAHALYVTENTVKTHIASLYRKLGAERRADALRQARRSGLL